MIEDARRRQRHQRRVGLWLLSLAAAAALIGGLVAGGGGGGSDHGGLKLSRPSGGSGAGGAAHASASDFPGAPVSQRNGYGVETDYCPLAAANRYLPARAGCVEVRRADLTGDGHSDLVIVYSTLDHTRWPSFPGGQASMRNDYGATAAYLRVVLPGGAMITTRVKGTPLTHATAIDAVAHVGDQSGDEIFLAVSQISSGADAVAYGLRAGRLVSAGVGFSYGGDSGARQGFDCVADPPRVVQRTYVLIGPTIYGWWKETRSVYAWNGPRLVRVSSRSFREHGWPERADTAIGQGCIKGIA